MSSFRLLPACLCCPLCPAAGTQALVKHTLWSPAYINTNAIPPQRPNGKKNLVRLKEGGSFTLDGSQIPHSAILEAGAGAVITAAHTRRNGSTGTRTVRVLEPAFEDFCSLNSRDTTPSYPKDCAAVSLLLGLAPGQSILEAGTGEGGMTSWRARAVGRSGAVQSFGVRQYAQDAAQRELKRFFGRDFNKDHGGNVNFHIGDMCTAPTEGEGFCVPPFLPDGLSVDGVVLDMMTPWVSFDTPPPPPPPPPFFLPPPNPHHQYSFFFLLRC